MKIEVLVSTMFCEDQEALLRKMNIRTDAIVINQCNNFSYTQFFYQNNSIKWFDLCERGVGLSRNNAMMRSTADILLFADDDVCYIDGYEEIVKSFFVKNSNVDVAVFNLISQNSERPETIIDKEHYLHWYNCLKYGAFRIAVRREKILKSNIFFTLLFGGGAEYQAGEDNLFITSCIQSGLKCMASSDTIGTVKQECSTWFKGYNQKYFIDRGKLFSAMYGKWYFFPLILFELRKKNKEFPILKRLKLEFQGAKDYLS